jgi:hypothetical protein
LNTWLKRYKIDTWNIYNSHITDPRSEMINRTNNPLERFNRTMNENFPTPHPSLLQFINVIKEISVSRHADLLLIARNDRAAPVHQPVRVEILPKDYTDWLNTIA